MCRPANQRVKPAFAPPQVGVSGSEALSRSSSMSLTDSMAANGSSVRHSPSDSLLSADLRAGLADTADLSASTMHGDTISNKHTSLCGGGFVEASVLEHVQSDQGPRIQGGRNAR